MITAKNAKNQSKVNKFIKADSSYDKLIDQDKDGSLKAEIAYNLASSYFEDLPVYEQNNLKSNGIIGY